ncbi:MAG TPA: hypothetical protein VHQ65_03390 [Thermoanaerobaculia bacterium]|nr:hypothetical protein [Thermoanaerobaculia bacterium]
MSSNRRSLLVTVLAGLIFTPVASAACTRSPAATGEVDGNVLAASVKLQTLRDGTKMLHFEGGPVATNAVRIYSEPSHTLLFVAADKEFGESGAGKTWWSESEAEKAVARITTGDLPTAKLAAQVPKRPAGDQRIAVWVHGCWPDGTENDRLLADGWFPAGQDFGFSTAVEREAGR